MFLRGGNGDRIMLYFSISEGIAAENRIYIYTQHKHLCIALPWSGYNVYNCTELGTG